MSNKDTLFYRGSTSISVDFSGAEISSDESLILLEKIERKKLQKINSKLVEALASIVSPHTHTHTHNGRSYESFVMDK